MINKNKNNSSNIVTPAKLGNYKKIFLYSLLVIIALFVFGDVGFADNSVTTPPVTNDGKTLLTVSTIVGVVGSLLGVLTSIVTLLLNPGWVNGEIFGLTGYLKQMWIIISNAVYFIFAGIIIAIAFMNIIGKGNGKFELKQALPKFIVGILIVPASWFIVQFILSISAVLTASVLTLPYDTFQGQTNSLKQKVDWCDQRTFNLQGKIGSGTTSGTNTGSGSFFTCTSQVKNKTLEQIMSMEEGNTQKIYGVMAFYTFGVMDLGDLDKFKNYQLSNIQDIFKLTAKVVFDLVFIVMYLILLIALFLALFVRGVRLWSQAMMSPLFGLIYFLGDKSGESLKKFSFKSFIGLAMVPVYVAAALSFGLMFLLIIGEGLDGSNTSNSGLTKNASGVIDLGYTTLKIEGSTGNEKDGFLSTISNGALGTLGYLILKIFGLAILWIAVMTALKASDITKTIVEPIVKFGESVGGLVMSAPKYIPIPGTGGLSAQGLESAMGTVSSEITSKANKSGSQWAYNQFPGLFEGEKDYIEKLNNLKSVNNDIDKTFKAIRDLLGTKDLQDISTRQNAKDEIVAKLKASSAGISDATLKLITDSRGKDQLEEALMKAHNETVNIRGTSRSLLGGSTIIDNDDVSRRVKGGGSTPNNVTINFKSLGDGKITDSNGFLQKGKGKDLGEYLVRLNAFKNGEFDEKKVRELIEGDKADIDELINYLNTENYGKSGIVPAPTSSPNHSPTP